MPTNDPSNDVPSSGRIPSALEPLAASSSETDPVVLRYAPELGVLAQRFGVTGEIAETGGSNNWVIQADLGVMPGSDGRRVMLCVANADPGLAEQRSEGMHWSAGIYDAELGGPDIAAGHHKTSFDEAVGQAVANLAAGAPPPEGWCGCTSHHESAVEAATMARGVVASEVVESSGATATRSNQAAGADPEPILPTAGFESNPGVGTGML